MADFILVKQHKTQPVSVWTHISEIFGSFPASENEDAAALDGLKQDFPVQWSIISNKHGTRVMARSLASLLRQYNKGRSEPIRSALELVQYLKNKRKNAKKTKKVQWYCGAKYSTVCGIGFPDSHCHILYCLSLYWENRRGRYSRGWTGKRTY